MIILKDKVISNILNIVIKNHQNNFLNQNQKNIPFKFLNEPTTFLLGNTPNPTYFVSFINSG